MKNIDLTPLIQALILFASSVISIYLLPKVKSYLAEKLSAEQRENLKKWVRIAVAAAEQLYGSKTGAEKKEYVVSFLLSKGLVFDADEVTTIIESEVYKLSQEYKMITPPEEPAEVLDEYCGDENVPTEEAVPEETDSDEESNLFTVRNTCE